MPRPQPTRTDYPCSSDILDVIGAGATAKTDKDWGQLWNESEEAKQVQQQINKFHEDKQGEASQADKSPDSKRSYAASLWTQYTVVQGRAFSNYNRDVTCTSSPASSPPNPVNTLHSADVGSKIGLNVIAGLFIGTFATLCFS